MTDPASRTPAEHLGILIKQTQALLHQRMDEALRPLGLTVPQYVCLQTLHDSPGITGSELARRTFVSRQSMSVLVQGLERRGLVERSEAPGARRERDTALTGEATSLVRDGRRAVAAVVDGVADALGPDRVDALLHELAAARDALASP